jgi:Ribbon-helix-helix protein, copG family
MRRKGGRPRLLVEPRLATFKLDEPLDECLQQALADLHVPMSIYIRRALRERLDRDGYPARKQEAAAA